LRAFIAINFDKCIKKILYNHSKKILTHNFKCFRQIKQKNIHMTIHFLGDISNDTNAIENKMERILSSYYQFIIKINNWNCFDTRKGKIVWLKVNNSEKLNILANKIRVNFSDIKEDKKSFLPHVTIARDAKYIDGISSKEIVDLNLKVVVKEISLMRSVFDSNGVHYSEIYNKALLKKDF